ncbi:MAG: hypothetical protein DSY59_05725 [Persephonella sp.]|nr:MAG: hypothetical protein DSY59_05725 [Persephonella sp.]
MKYFRYTGIDSSGKEVSGIEEAPSLYSLRKSLTSKGIVLIEAKEVSRLTDETKEKKFLLKRSLFSKKISDEELALLFYEIGLLLSRNVYITEIFNILSKQVENKNLQDVLLSVKTYLQEGKSLGEALEKAKIFPQFLVEMVKAGEESGALDKIFLSASEFLEQQADFKSKIKSSLIYPTTVIVIGFIAMIIVINVVIPKILKIYAQFNTELPLSTKIVLYISNFFNIFLKGIPIFILLVFIFKKKFITQEKIDKIRLKIPFFKKVHIYSQYFMWSNTMAVLLRGGLTLDKALNIANKTISNSIIKRQFEKIVEDIRKGKSLSEVLYKNKLIPENSVLLIKIGEETAQMEDMFQLIAKIYKKEIEKLINIFLKYLEPISLLVVSVLIGFFIVATILPIFSLKIR